MKSERRKINILEIKNSQIQAFFYKDCKINVCSSIITHTKGILFKIYSMLAIQKHLAIEYRPINLVVIIFVPLSDSYLTHYSNLVIIIYIYLLKINIFKNSTFNGTAYQSLNCFKILIFKGDTSAFLRHLYNYFCYTRYCTLKMSTLMNGRENMEQNYLMFIVHSRADIMDC